MYFSSVWTQTRPPSSILMTTAGDFSFSSKGMFSEYYFLPTWTLGNPLLIYQRCSPCLLTIWDSVVGTLLTMICYRTELPSEGTQYSIVGYMTVYEYYAYSRQVPINNNYKLIINSGNETSRKSQTVMNLKLSCNFCRRTWSGPGSARCWSCPPSRGRDWGPGCSIPSTGVYTVCRPRTVLSFFHVPNVCDELEGLYNV